MCTTRPRYGYRESTHVKLLILVDPPYLSIVRAGMAPDRYLMLSRYLKLCRALNFAPYPMSNRKILLFLFSSMACQKGEEVRHSLQPYRPESSEHTFAPYRFHLEDAEGIVDQMGSI